MAPGSNVELAREFRREPTRSEQLLWDRLRGRGIAGMKFRRQHPVGGLVLDFYCHRSRLCVEVDGAVHDGPEATARDRDRDAALASLGLRVLRIRADDVEQDIEAVLARIAAAK